MIKTHYCKDCVHAENPSHRDTKVLCRRPIGVSPISGRTVRLNNRRCLDERTDGELVVTDSALGPSIRVANCGTAGSHFISLATQAIELSLEMSTYLQQTLTGLRDLFGVSHFKCIDVINAVTTGGARTASLAEGLCGLRGVSTDNIATIHSQSLAWVFNQFAEKTVSGLRLHKVVLFGRAVNRGSVWAVLESKEHSE